MSTSATTSRPVPASASAQPRGRGARVAVGLLALVAAPGALMVTVLAAGPGVLLINLLYVATLWLLLDRMRRPLDGVRVLLAVVAAAMTGVGSFVGMLMVGIMAEVVPLLSQGDYPHADAWTALSGAVGFVAGALVLGLGLLVRRRTDG